MSFGNDSDEKSLVARPVHSHLLEPIIIPIPSFNGQSAVVFVNARQGRALRLRGVYARVVEDGLVSVGDRVVKVT